MFIVLKGTSFYKRIYLLFNNIFIAVNILLNIGTLNRVFIYKRLAKHFKKVIRAKKKKFEPLILIAAFQGKKVRYIKYVTINHVSIDKKKFYNEPITYLDLGDINIIVGKK